jgi:hypothetical protein
MFPFCEQYGSNEGNMYLDITRKQQQQQQQQQKQQHKQN